MLIPLRILYTRVPLKVRASLFVPEKLTVSLKVIH